MNNLSEVKYKTSEYLAKQVINLISNLSDENLERLMFILEQAIPKANKNVIIIARKAFERGHPTLNLVKNLLNKTNQNCRNKIFINFILNGLILNKRKRNKILEEKGFLGPTTILISPTMRCNFNCKKCYASEYKQENDLPFELADKVVKEGKELGVGFYVILGGEPFIRRDLLDLFKKHNDAYFLVFTNGSLINENLANKLVELGNVFPMLSLEGFGDKTDKIRGKGTYEHLINVMDLLRNKGIPFGYSVVSNRNNVKEIISDKFVDFMIQKGAYLGFYLLYMPIGKDPDLKLMPTPEQRKYLLERGGKIRNTKPLFFVDFWNDAPFMNGCIAGRHYLHVNCSGDVEPCIFVHFAQDNIRDKSLKEVLDSNFFRALRKRQPYKENLFLPCLIMDNPDVLKEIKKELKIKPTHPGAENLYIGLKRGIEKYSKEVEKVYEPIWEDFKSKRNSK